MHADAAGVDALVELYVVDAGERMFVFAEDPVIFLFVKALARKLRAVEVIVHRLDQLIADLVRRIGEDDVDMAPYPLYHAAQQLVEAVA